MSMDHPAVLIVSALAMVVLVGLCLWRLEAPKDEDDTPPQRNRDEERNPW